MKKIIVVGAGIGGLITAALLSKNNFDVEIIEQKDINDIGYDWIDTFDITPFDILNIPLTNYEIIKENITTINSPSNKKSIIIRSHSKRVKMNRKDLSKQLIDYAISSNVKIIFNKKIDKLIIDNNKIVGIYIDNKEKYCDLVIDSSGINSVLKNQANDFFGVNNDLKENQIFYVYREFNYEKSNNMNNDIYLNEKGISWIIEDKNYIDLLIGSTKILTKEQLEKELNKLKKTNNNIENICLSNNLYKIPIRYPLSQMVFNGYVLIGDAAYMTVPITGSGLSLSTVAAKILADILLKNKDTNFFIEDLWEYQVEYFKTTAVQLSMLDIYKIQLLKLTNKEIEFIFKNINGYTNIEFLPLKKFIIIIKNITNMRLIKILLNVLTKKMKLKNICNKIPKIYDKELVDNWKNLYDSEFIDK